MRQAARMDGTLTVPSSLYGGDYKSRSTDPGPGGHWRNEIPESDVSMTMKNKRQGGSMQTHETLVSRRSSCNHWHRRHQKWDGKGSRQSLPFRQKVQYPSNVSHCSIRWPTGMTLTHILSWMERSEPSKVYHVLYISCGIKDKKIWHWECHTIPSHWTVWIGVSCNFWRSVRNLS